MRLPQHGLRAGDEFNMTPMIDVVFLLIIFFLVSSHLAKQESFLELDLPTAQSGVEAQFDESPRVTVNVLGDGKLQISGRNVTKAQLTTQFQEVRQDAGEDVEIRIRSDRSAPYQFVEPILLACARTGIWNVTFAVYQEE